MRILDENFKQNKLQYILQCLMAIGVLAFALFLLDVVLETVIVASLGATSFIVFSMPHKINSKTRLILLGYTIGILVGSLWFWLLYFYPIIPVSIGGAIAVGTSMFLMVIFDAEHPPASGLALGIVIQGFDIYSIIYVYILSLILIFMKNRLNKWLIDLI